MTRKEYVKRIEALMEKWRVDRNKLLRKLNTLTDKFVEDTAGYMRGEVFELEDSDRRRVLHDLGRESEYKRKRYVVQHASMNRDGTRQYFLREESDSDDFMWTDEFELRHGINRDGFLNRRYEWVLPHQCEYVPPAELEKFKSESRILNNQIEEIDAVCKKAVEGLDTEYLDEYAKYQGGQQLWSIGREGDLPFEIKKVEVAHGDDSRETGVIYYKLQCVIQEWNNLEVDQDTIKRTYIPVNGELYIDAR